MSRKRIIFAALILIMVLMLAMTGCGGSGDQQSSGLDNGTYVATFKTDNSMFHVNEANNDKGILTVEDGQMTIHVSLASKNIINLYPGLAEDAAKDGAVLLEPSTDKVVYSDGYEDEVYGFDIPVPALDEEFDCALLGTKGKWYDHKVVVSDPVKGDDIHAEDAAEAETEGAVETSLEPGDYKVELTLEGGSGRATVESPAELKVENGSAILTVIWSSPYYDYMIVDGEKYLPVNEEGNSTFEIPVKVFNEPFDIIGDTVAMSEPHEVEYKLTCTVIE